MNPSPTLSEISEARAELSFVDGKLRHISRETIFELIRDIRDPEHPYSLERLGVVRPDDIDVGEIRGTTEALKHRGLPLKYVSIVFRPTIPHCSMAGVIGLAIKLQMLKYVGEEYWTRVFVAEDTHVSWRALCKQLNDKDRVMAALENVHMVEMLDSIIPKYGTER
eukprot:jgi/Antlo1/729/163